MKTDDLSGALLDYYAGKAAGEEVYLWSHQREGYRMCVRIVDGRAVGYSPSTDWVQGGCIIENSTMEFERSGIKNGEDFHMFNDSCGTESYGSTMLIAACRFVVAKFWGDTVPGEVPT